MSEVREGQADSKRFGVLFILDYYAMCSEINFSFLEKKFFEFFF